MSAAARAELGYLPAPTRALEESPIALKRCRDCGDDVTMLFNKPGEARRLVCGVCQGKENRRIVDAVRACIVTLKTSTDPNDERAAALDLVSLLGRDDADASISAIAAGKAEGRYRDAAPAPRSKRGGGGW